MLFGTSLLFRIAYFFTSFSPALLLLSLNFLYRRRFCTGLRVVNKVLGFLMYWILPILVVMVAITAALIIKRYLLKRQNDRVYEIPNLALNFNISPKRFKNKKNGYVIQVQNGVKINSGFIAFAISVVAPSVVLTLNSFSPP